MTWRPSWPHEIPFILDTLFSLIVIIGYWIISPYCQYLISGPCNTRGPNFLTGVGLMIAGSAGLTVFRVYRLKTKVILAKILVLTEGTIIKEELEENHRMIGGGIIGDTAGKLGNWRRQGAQIVYLTSRRRPVEVEIVRRILKQGDLPKGKLFYRKANEEYKDVAERIRPDMIVEDDRASIGGEKEMTYPHIKPELRAEIRSVVVREFGGIDHLPNSVLDLLNYQTPQPPG